MQWFRNRKTTTKLMLGFCLMAALTAFVGYEGLQGMGMIEEELVELYNRHALGLSHLKEANIQLLMISRGVRNAVLDDDVASVERRIANAKKYDAIFRQEFEAYQKTIPHAEDKAKAADVERLYRELRPEQDKLFELARLGRDAEARAGLTKIRTMEDDLDARMTTLEEVKLHLMEQSENDAEAAYKKSRTFVIAVIAVTVALAVGVGFFIARLIAQPLGQAVGVLQAMAGQDFTQHLAIDSRDEVGQMATALNQAVDAMRQALQEVSTAADQMATAS
jgi:methyl-accepting chemotaxis protein